MDCLKNLVSLSAYCSLPVPSSGLYLETLPGITTEISQKIADTDSPTFLDVWNKVFASAVQRLRMDTLFLLQESISFNPILWQSDSPRISNRGTTYLATLENRGIYLKLPAHKYVEFQLNAIKLYVESFEQDASREVTIYITDPITGIDLVEPKSYPIITGMNILPVNKVIRQDLYEPEILIMLDFSGINTVYFSGSYAGEGDCYKTCQCKDEIEIFPVVGNYENRQNHYSGIYLDAQAVVNIDHFICDYKNQFAPAFRFLLGAEFMDYKLASHKLNIFTTSNLEFTRDLKTRLASDYSKTLKATLKTLPLHGLPGSCEGTSEVYSGWAGL